MINWLLQNIDWFLLSFAIMTFIKCCFLQFKLEKTDNELWILDKKLNEIIIELRKENKNDETK